MGFLPRCPQIREISNHIYWVFSWRWVREGGAKFPLSAHSLVFNVYFRCFSSPQTLTPPSRLTTKLHFLLLRRKKKKEVFRPEPPPFPATRPPCLPAQGPALPPETPGPWERSPLHQARRSGPLQGSFVSVITHPTCFIIQLSLPAGSSYQPSNDTQLPKIRATQNNSPISRAFFLFTAKLLDSSSLSHSGAALLLSDPQPALAWLTPIQAPKLLSPRSQWLLGH